MNDQQMLEASENAVKAAGDYCIGMKIASGLTGKQHAGAIIHALVDAGLLLQEGDEANCKSQRLHAWAIVNELENGSALRQKLEKAKVLGGPAAVSQEYVK